MIRDDKSKTRTVFCSGPYCDYMLGTTSIQSAVMQDRTSAPMSSVDSQTPMLYPVLDPLTASTLH
jgi:hypothetical protein